MTKLLPLLLVFGIGMALAAESDTGRRPGDLVEYRIACLNEHVMLHVASRYMDARFMPEFYTGDCFRLPGPMSAKLIRFVEGPFTPVDAYGGLVSGDTGSVWAIRDLRGKIVYAWVIDRR